MADAFFLVGRTRLDFLVRPKVCYGTMHGVLIGDKLRAVFKGSVGLAVLWLVINGPFLVCSAVHFDWSYLASVYMWSGPLLQAAQVSSVGPANSKCMFNR